MQFKLLDNVKRLCAENPSANVGFHAPTQGRTEQEQSKNTYCRVQDAIYTNRNQLAFEVNANEGLSLVRVRLFVCLSQIHWDGEGRGGELRRWDIR